MSRFNPIVYTGILLVFVVLYGGVSWLAGGLYLDTHEGDSYHFLDILLRMSDGQIPHRDFVTPLGILFPLFIVLLVPVRLLAGRFFTPEELAALDSEEEPEEEETQRQK